MRSTRSAVSQPLSWNLIQHTVGTPTNVAPMDVSERSRPSKRSDYVRSSVASASPRRNSGARGSDQVPLAADQRLDMLIAESRSNIPRGGEASLRGNLVWCFELNPWPLNGSPNEVTPRELTRTLNATPENIPITDITSDETVGELTT